MSMIKVKNDEGKIVWSVMLGSIAGWFIAPLILLWSWGVVAPHLNAPLFGYWEMFAIYLGLRIVGKALFRREG